MSPATQPSPRPSNGSFASMIEQLTGISSDSGSQSNFEDAPAHSDRYQQATHFEPRSSSIDQAAAKASSSTKAPAPPRSLLAVKQVQTPKTRPDREPMPLSYEKALRLHTRNQPSSSTARTQPAPTTPALKTNSIADTVKSTQKPRPANAQGPPASLPAKAKRSPSATHPASAATAKPAAKVSANRTSKHKQPLTTASAVQTSAKAAKPTNLPSNAPTVSRRAGSKHRASSAKRTHQTKPAIEFQAPGIPALPDTTDLEILRLVNRLNAADRAPQPNALELESSLSSQLDSELAHRTATISVRLNETEFSDLRQRAAESGISVSAYMRSCVLEAEHLRAQVKQALTAMRAATLPEPALLPASTGLIKSNTDSASASWLKRLKGLAAKLTGLQPTSHHPF